MELIDLGVIVLNWNGVSDTLACLESIYQQAAVPEHVVVVDNGSSDDSVAAVIAWLAAQGRYSVERLTTGETATVREYRLQPLSGDPGGVPPGSPACRFALIANDRNLGFAAGNNVGIRYLLERTVKYVLLLNNDTVVADGALATLARAMDGNPQVQCMIPQIRYWGAPTRIWNCGGSWSWFGSPRYYHAEADIAVLERQKPFTIGFVTGCALLIRSDELVERGGLSERFFHGEEDVEFSWRMRESGPNAMMCWPAAVVYHKVGTSVSKMAQRSKLPLVYCHYLNRLIFLRTVWGRGLRWQLRRAVTAAYLAWLLYRHFRLPSRVALATADDLRTDASVHDGVSAELFMWIMREKFRTVSAA